MNEFDNWRSKYEMMTLAEQVEYHNDLESRYPEQAHFNYSNVMTTLKHMTEGSKILEFGCWKGDMAEMALHDFPSISEWIGIEICEAAIKKTKCHNPKFKYIFPDDFNWFETTTRPDCNIILATHFIEHLSNEHFESLAKYCKGVEWIYFEAPLSQADREWDGYEGTHKLNYGWDNVTKIMSEQGYDVFAVLSDGVIFKFKA